MGAKLPEQPTTKSKLSFDTRLANQVSWSAATPVGEARTKSALGYSPMGADDPNFNPEFRRRYYLNDERLLERLQVIMNVGEDPDVHEHQLEIWINDLRWTMKERKRENN